MAVPFLLVALNLSSQTALSFVPALAIIFITVWSRLILHIKLTIYDLLALAFILPGIILIIVFSTVRNVDLYSWELSSYLFSVGAIIFLSIMSTLMITIGVVVYQILKKFNKLSKDARDVNPNSGDEEIVESKETCSEILNYKR